LKFFGIKTSTYGYLNSKGQLTKQVFGDYEKANKYKVETIGKIFSKQLKSII